MKCKECNHNLFEIEKKTSCEDCKNNGAYDDNYDLIYDEAIIEKKELIRDSVENDGECYLGVAYGSGCYIFSCAKCGGIDYLPFVEN